MEITIENLLKLGFKNNHNPKIAYLDLVDTPEVNVYLWYNEESGYQGICIAPPYDNDEEISYELSKESFLQSIPEINQIQNRDL